MKYLKFIWIIPVLIMMSQLILFSQNKTTSYINPVSSKNEYLSALTKLLTSANLNVNQITLEPNNEIKLQLLNKPAHLIPVIISTDKSALSQVNALQKIIKIANIKEKEIKFIDLGSNRPYATL